ncbi:MBL fold metallo-hydrolase [Proteobacteria bacterium 005FR1]|nr:MBL fold metallo-hydrolase [Proteobacteria bacterium 005FR1]
MQYPDYHDLGFGITRIDTGLIRPGFASCYLMAHEGRLAVIETGTGQTVAKVLKLINELGYEASAVDYVIITHVHLDHAGGAGGLMDALPEARLVVHPRGARHMQDPSKLQAGAIAVYGEKIYYRDYGELIPIPEERMIIAEDNTAVDLAGRQLRIFDTPGHARHHFCVYDEASRGIFTGDTLGIVYPELCENGKSFVLPTTTPVQFEPDAFKESIDRLMALKPQYFFLTHYGMVEASESHADQLKQQIDDYVRIALKHKDNQASRLGSIAADLLEYTLERLRNYGSSLEENRMRQLIAGDMALNAQGLEVWLQKNNDEQS